MPIRPENKARYPKDWPAISQRIRLRAGNKCEFCGVPNHQLGAWINGHWHVAWPKGSGERDRPRQGEEFPCHRGEVVEWRKVVRVVLTVAHLDHKPENCADESRSRSTCSAALAAGPKGLLAEGYDVIGFDIEQHVYGEHRYPAELVDSGRADAARLAVQGCRADRRLPALPGIQLHGDAVDAGEGEGGGDPGRHPGERSKS
jgi:hypothetical protein